MHIVTTIVTYWDFTVGHHEKSMVYLVYLRLLNIVNNILYIHVVAKHLVKFRLTTIFGFTFGLTMLFLGCQYRGMCD